MKKLFPLCFLLSCSSTPEFKNTQNYVDIQRFMGEWYVQAYRGTFLEKDVKHPIEKYTYNNSKNRIDIEYSFYRDGERSEINQKAWIINKETNHYWKVSPFWPIKLDYIVIDIEDDYSISAVGVPNQKYLWIMSRDKNYPKVKLEKYIQKIANKGYAIHDLTYPKFN